MGKAIACLLLAGWIPATAAAQGGASPAPARQVQFRSGPVVLQEGTAERVRARLGDGWQGSFPAVVVFERRPDRAEAAALERGGVRLGGYLGGTAYEVYADAPDALSFASGAPRVLAADLFEPGWKVGRRLLEADSLQDIPTSAQDEGGRVLLYVTFHPGTPEPLVRQVLDGFAPSSRYARDVWRASAGFDELLTLASEERVRAISIRHVGTGEDLDVRARGIVRTELVQDVASYGPAPSYGGRTGKGVRIAICDRGISQTHQDFFYVDSAGQPTSESRIYGSHLVEGTKTHGTEVASVAGGSGVASSAWEDRPAFSLRGHAPLAELGSYAKVHASETSTPIDEAYHEMLVTDGSDIVNHSYALDVSEPTAPADEESTPSRVLDEIIAGDYEASDGDGGTVLLPARPSVWAAGNDGSLSVSGAAAAYGTVLIQSKNAIVVGSTTVDETGELFETSSLGPTWDRRIRPDVVAPGGLVAFATGAKDEYRIWSGTSYAAPVVTAALALAMEEFSDETGLSTWNLPPSLFRALVVGTARDLVRPREPELGWVPPGIALSPEPRYPVGPDLATGFGLLDAEALCAALADENRWEVEELEQAGDADEYCLDVPAGLDELRVAIAWDDPVPAAAGAVPLTNDFDLTVIHDDGLGNVETYHPWCLDLSGWTLTGGDHPPEATRGVDRWNNVELVSVRRPDATGTWTVRVESFAQDPGAQTYSLVTSEPIEWFCTQLVDLPLIPWPDLEWWPWPFDPWSFDRSGDVVSLPARAVHPLDHLQHLLAGPPALVADPGDVVLRLARLPAGARVLVFDEEGTIAEDGARSDGGTVREIVLSIDAPERRRYLALFPPEGEEFALNEQGRIDLDVALYRPEEVDDLTVLEAVLPPGVEPSPAPAGGAPADASYHRVRLGGRVFTPRPSRDVPADLRRAREANPPRGPRAPVHALVQFHREPTARERIALAAERVHLVERLGGATYVARVGPGDGPARSRLLRWAGPLPAEDKLGPGLRSRPAGEPARVVVTFHADVPPVAGERLLDGRDTELLDRDRWALELDAGAARELARHDAVRRVALDPRPARLGR